MRLLVGLVALLSGCQPVSLSERPYACDLAHPCAAGFRCDCGTCVSCSGAQCEACALEGSAQQAFRLDGPPAARAVDCTGNDRDGLLSGPEGTTLEAPPGQRGEAWRSPTPGARLSLGERGLGAGPGTVAFFVQSTGSPGQTFVESRLDATVQAVLEVRGAQVTVGGAALSDSLGAAFSSAAFSHVALVVDAGRLSLWLDGVLRGSTSYTLEGPSVATFGLERAVDEVRVYRRALTRSELEALAAGQCSP